MRLEPRHPRWPIALLIGAAASGLALLLQDVMRQTWQIRSLPERVMEWLLLFVPLDLFEAGLQKLGSDAKDVALLGTTIGMALVLALIGAVVVRRDWPSWRVLALGLGLWLLVMGVVMPITGAGFFATGLLFSPVLTSAAYLMICLGYASALVGGRLLSVWARGTRPLDMAADRRAFVGGLVGSLAAYGLARYLGREGGLVASSLPLAAIPTGTPAPVEQASQPTEAPAAAQGAQNAAPQPLPTLLPTPTLEPLPNPPPPRQLARNQDGSLTAAGRPKGQLAPPVTANDDFYIVTKNAVADPNIDVATWRLIIDGEVNQPVQVDYRTLRTLPAVEVTKTLECISNFTAQCNLTSFGCDLLSTARWKGARLSDLLALAGGLKPGVVGLACISVDEFSAGLPIEVASDPETLVIYEMHGQPLPREHGFPARLLVPGRYGMKNPKWLVTIRPVRQEYAGYYEQRNWNKDGIVKTMARIDVPVDGATLSPGPQRVAGVAYAGNRGVQQVEFSADGGQTWEAAEFLEPMPGKDAMVRWQGTFVLDPDTSTTLVVRATDGSGAVQTAEFSLPQPDGASGRHSITVQAG